MKLRVTKVFFDFRKFKKQRGNTLKFDSYETMTVSEKDSTGVVGFDEALRIVEIGQFRLEKPAKKGFHTDEHPTVATLWLGNDEDDHIADIEFVFGCFEALVNEPYFDTKKGRHDFPVNNRTTVLTLLTKVKKVLTQENTK